MSKPAQCSACGATNVAWKQSNNSSLQEHICSDGHPDWGDGIGCPNCATRGGRSKAEKRSEITR